MGCGDHCPVLPSTVVLDWPLPDPKGQPVERVREIREEVRRRVEELIGSQGWGRTGGRRPSTDTDPEGSGGVG